MTAMPIWDWRFRRNTHHLRTELRLAVAELEVFTAALRHEINRTTEGARDDHQRGPTD
jgi:uncharacterized small protein (DUF1192 family)